MKKTILKTVALVAVACSALLGCSKQQTPANKIQVEIVAVYQVPGGAWETCLKREDGTRSLWTNHKLGEPGDKFSIWARNATEWLQDPNTESSHARPVTHD
jgi:hypothetical protein